MKKINIFLVACGLIYLNFMNADVNDFSKPITTYSPGLKSREDFLKLLPKNGIIVEVGVWGGDFSEQILKYCNPKHLYLVDCWEDNRLPQYQYNLNVLYQKVLKKFANNPRVTIIKAFSPEAANLFEDNFFDVVYIDANHYYEGVKKDLLGWHKKVKIGGLISGHDYFRGSTAEHYAVVRAVNEFLFNNKLELHYLTDEVDSSFAIIRTLQDVI